MVTCELCGKGLRTSQGLRGHKTFVHGLRASHDEQGTTLPHGQLMEESGNEVGAENGEYRDRIEKLESEVLSNSESMVELRRIVKELQNELVSAATRSDTDRVARTVEALGNQLDKHDRWFNPDSIDEAILGLSGGPIAALKRRLDGRRYVMESGDRRHRLKPGNSTGYRISVH